MAIIGRAIALPLQNEQIPFIVVSIFLGFLSVLATSWKIYERMYIAKSVVTEHGA
jgi:hypothetical protein